jgi:hypothetical protein
MEIHARAGPTNPSFPFLLLLLLPIGFYPRYGVQEKKELDQVGSIASLQNESYSMH